MSGERALVLPPTVCVRVTRACNAFCAFCLAPPDGQRISLTESVRRFRWLAANGTGCVHLCGGEPTVLPELPSIVSACSNLGLQIKLTTNGIRISEDLRHALVRARTRVKVSLHGPPAVHDRMLGRPCFDLVARSIQVLRTAGIFVSTQTAVTRQNIDALEWVVDYCRANGISKASFIPFMRRGLGSQHRDDHELSRTELKHAIALVETTRTDRNVDVRWVDTSSRGYFVLETDGCLYIQRDDETEDEFVAKVSDAR